MFTATYSPEDNKLRLYSASRLDAETYAKVKATGFTWAPKQELFVAPMWTPERADLLTDLCGEIGDEDTSLVDRAEERAERFGEYSEHRAEDATGARDAVAKIADGIPFGQPILIGHHSERHARKDAEKIENGMRRAVKMWETAQYWKYRAAGAIRAAKYKELPAVRVRRIKGLEADKRKHERTSSEADMWLRLWTACAEEQDKELQLGVAKRLANMCWLHLPRKAGDSDKISHSPTAYDVLTDSCPTLYVPRTLQEVLDAAAATYPRTIAYCDRWITHISNRLEYERAMLEEAGEAHRLDKKPRPTQLPLCNYRAPEGLSIENNYNRGEKIRYAQVEMTQAEYAKIYTDYKGTRVIDHSHRVRIAIIRHSSACVFLTDSKVHDRPAAAERAPIEPRPMPTYTPRPVPEPNEFDAMKESLRAGVKVVSAFQLFPTPPDLARRIVLEAGGVLLAGQRVLEPSAGTGNIIRAAVGAVTGFDCIRVVAVEINGALVEGLREYRQKALYATEANFEIRHADFLECNGDLGRFDAVIMNPPFADGADIKHIQHAATMLKPGGRLVAVCANGPRQQDRLRPWVEDQGGIWEELPPDTFKSSGTSVNSALLVVNVG